MGITEEFRANDEALTFNDEVRSLIFMEMGEDEVENINDFAALSRLKGALSTGEVLNGNAQDIFSLKDKEGFNILLLAASLGFSDKVSVIIGSYRQLLQSQGHGEGEVETKLLQMIETVDNNGMTALNWACHKGYGSVLTELVKASANINSVTQNASTPLILASSCGHIEIVSFLLNCSSQKVDINAGDRDGKTALIWACSCGFSSIATLLLNFGANVELKDISLYSALLWAASRDKVDVIRTLLDHKANVEVRNRVGYTPLILAAFFCHLETCRVLIEKGKADIEARDNNDNTALQSACRRKLTAFDAKRIIQVVSFLLDNGANAEAANALGSTCLISASQLGNMDVVTILVQQGRAKVNAVDKIGCSALMYACREANFEVARFLIMNDADLSLRCQLGSSALEYIGDDDIQQLFASNVETYNATKVFPDIDQRMVEYSERVKQGSRGTINNAARILTQRLYALSQEQKNCDDDNESAGEFPDAANSRSYDDSAKGSSRRKSQGSPRRRPPTSTSAKQQSSNASSRNPTPNRSRVPTPTQKRSASPRSVSPRVERSPRTSDASISSLSSASAKSLTSTGSAVKKRSASPFNLSSTNRPSIMTKADIPPLPPFANLSANPGLLRSESPKVVSRISAAVAAPSRSETPNPVSRPSASAAAPPSSCESRSESPKHDVRPSSFDALAVSSPNPKKVVAVPPRSANGKQQKAEPPKPKQGNIKKEGNSKFLGDLNWKSRFFVLITSTTGQTLLSYFNGAVSCDTFKGMTVSESTGLCSANTDQKGIYDLKGFTVQSLEDNAIALTYRGDAALGESIGKDAAKDAINKKGERDIHLKFDTAKEKRDWTESLKAHMAYGANLTQNTNDGKN